MKLEIKDFQYFEAPFGGKTTVTGRVYIDGEPKRKIAVRCKGFDLLLLDLATSLKSNPGAAFEIAKSAIETEIISGKFRDLSDVESQNLLGEVPVSAEEVGRALANGKQYGMVTIGTPRSTEVRSTT